MLTPSILVRHPRQLTVAWAQRVVASYAEAAVVSKVEILAVDIGTTTRVRLAVNHDGPETLPRRWFVKLPSQAWRAWGITALPRLLHTEVRFYQEVAPAVSIEVPTVIAAQRRRSWGTTLVLADVTAQGARPGMPDEALTAAQAALVVEELAHLHARFWNHPCLDGAYRWLAGPVRRWEDALGTAMAIPLMQRGLQRAGDIVSPPLQAAARRYARQRSHAMQKLAAGTRTLVHHDCHPGNLFWTPTRPGFLDWQLVRIAEGVGDVAYFCATALDPDTRRQYEADLLKRYHQGLAAYGVAGLDADTLWQRYRLHLTYPFEAMVVTLAVGGMMELQSNLTLLRRAATAVEDHAAFAAILA